MVLTVLARGPMTGYEITRAFDGNLAYFWRASHQQVYRELAALDAGGHVRHRAVAQAGKPDKKVYAITRKGRSELKRWVAAPTPLPRPQYELLVKLLAGDAVGSAELATDVARLMKETGAVLTTLETMDRECRRQLASAMSGFDKTMDLALRRGLLLIRAQEQWLGEVRDYLATGRLKR